MNEKLPTNEMVIIIRPSFKRVCGPDACRAALYNHILYRLARKAKDEPEAKVKAGEVFWYASAEDICQDIDEAWCVNKVRKEIKQLVTDGLLGQRHNPNKGWDRKFQYFIGPEQGEKLLEKTREKEVCLLHIGLNAEVTHLLHMVNAFNKNGACICQKEEMDLPDMVDASTKNGGAIPKGSTEGTSEESTKGSESTSPQPDRDADESGSVEPTRTHFAFQSFSEKGHDDANTTQQDQQPTGQDSREKRAATTEQPAGSVATAIPATVPTGKTAATAQLSTLQQSAKVAPRPSAFVAAPLFGAQKPARSQLTEEGKNVLEWYQIIQACKVRKTDANINACNGLGEEDGMSFDNLKKAIEHWEAHSYVKERQIPIDLQKLEDPKGAFTFAKAMLVIRPNKSKPPSERKPTLVSCANMSAEEYAAYLRR